MAESGNTQNIEDVLSSIRRLVSEDEVHAPRVAVQPSTQIEAKGESPAVDEVGDVQERLVLTPHLRVTEPEDPYQMIRALTEAAEAENAVVVSVEAKSDLAEPEPVLEAATSEVAAQSVTIAPDDAAAMDAAIPLYTEDQHYEPEGDAAAILADNADSAKALEEIPVAVEAVVDEPQATEEPKVVTLDASTLDGAIPFPGRAARNEDDISQEGTDFDDEGEFVLDEDTLREIISDVVREELAGHLGERITRNVRKLVRREIRQMMASEDFE